MSRSIEVLRRIAELLDEGLNLAGISRVLALEKEARLRGQLADATQQSPRSGPHRPS
jgi:DNA-binding transcriptional MerR regulator